MRGIEREVLVLGSLEQVEFDEAGHLGQLRIAAEPYFLEGLFGTFLHAEAVHGDEHGLVSCFNGARINLGMSATSPGRSASSTRPDGDARTRKRQDGIAARIGIHRLPVRAGLLARFLLMGLGGWGARKEKFLCHV